MIAIVDYGMGNLRSVINAFQYLGEDVVIALKPADLDEASHIVLPGVGAFADAMDNLRKSDLIGALSQQVFENRKPFLGICLGMQLLAKVGHEYGKHFGLGWIDAEVVKFEFENKRLKIPHVGWNDIYPQRNHPLFIKLNRRHATFYFVHSYYLECAKDENIAATCEYGNEFTAAVWRDNIFGTQFHPEKSQENGLQLLENFINWRP